MAEDHLNLETSFSAELTATGVKAAAKSRTIAALDRLIGNVADLGSAYLEAIALRQRAKARGDEELIEATAKIGLHLLDTDDEFARRAFGKHFKTVAAEQINKEAVALEALKDLRQSPPSSFESIQGSAELSSEYMASLEGYAKGAHTPELRERWGRVLAREIRQPGTFSRKVLRATDELDPSTAALFEKLMRYRSGEYLLRGIMPKLSLRDQISLVSADLIVEPGSKGHLTRFSQNDRTDRQQLWAANIGDLMVVFDRSASHVGDDNGDDNNFLIWRDGFPCYPVYILTDVGVALSSIIPTHNDDVTYAFAQGLEASISPQKVHVLRQKEPNVFTVVEPHYDGEKADTVHWAPSGQTLTDERPKT